MAYDADPNATHNPAPGAAPPAALGDIWNENFRVLGAPWTAFTPIWTGTTNPAIGNGTLSGAYKQIEKTLYVRYFIKMGTTTTYGSGNWRLTLPNSLTVSTSYTQLLDAFAQDFGIAHYVGHGTVGEHNSSSTLIHMWFDGNRSCNSGAPFAWGSTDSLTVEGLIQVA